MTDAIEDPIPSVPVDGVDTVSDGRSAYPSSLHRIPYLRNA
jgi:hypothetical protein